MGIRRNRIQDKEKETMGKRHELLIVFIRTSKIIMEKRRFVPVTLIEFYVTGIGNASGEFIANGPHSTDQQNESHRMYRTTLMESLENML
jgi:hypothetical protein